MAVFPFCSWRPGIERGREREREGEREREREGGNTFIVSPPSSPLSSHRGLLLLCLAQLTPDETFLFIVYRQGVRPSKFFSPTPPSLPLSLSPGPGALQTRHEYVSPIVPHVRWKLLEAVHWIGTNIFRCHQPWRGGKYPWGRETSDWFWHKLFFTTHYY